MTATRYCRIHIWGLALHRAVLVCLTLLMAVGVAAIPVSAKVTQKTVERPYWVSGVTARQLVDYMRRHPTRGDSGAVWAHIQPRFNLSVATRAGRKCSVRAVDLHINFLITLPRGRQVKAMKARTRRLWRSFTSFTRAHETRHRSIYLGCARKFVARAGKTPATANCRQLKSQVRRQMHAAMRACDRPHRAFDRREAGRLKRLPLLRAAK